MSVKVETIEEYRTCFKVSPSIFTLHNQHRFNANLHLPAVAAFCMRGILAASGLCCARASERARECYKSDKLATGAVIREQTATRSTTTQKNPFIVSREREQKKQFFFLCQRRTHL